MWQGAAVLNLKKHFWPLKGVKKEMLLWETWICKVDLDQGGDRRKMGLRLMEVTHSCWMSGLFFLEYRKDV